MKKTVITSGQAFTDIDVLACSLAYSELLTLGGIDSEVVLPGVLNSSITKTIRNWNLQFTTEPAQIDPKIVLVDISESEYFAKFVDVENVVEIFDHRYGFQDYWNEKLGASSHIDLVGACATLIWEEYKKKGFDNNISSLSANLLSTAILSNTLDFKASVTTDRDITAFNELKRYIDLPINWQEIYYKEVEENIYSDIYSAITSDLKTISISKLDSQIEMGQLELWQGDSFILNYQEEIKKVFSNNTDWLMSIVSISDNKNYIFTESDRVKSLLNKCMSINFQGNVGVTDKLWLRKEIRKKLLEM